jgi:hypothetical protein
MKRKVITWLLRVTLFLLLAVGLLIAIVLNPSFLYAHQTTIGTFTIHHNDTLDEAFHMRLHEASALTRKSEVTHPNYKMQVCLGGSFYPSLIRRLLGQGFAWGFFNIIVIAGTLEALANQHQSGWNLSQLLAHEITHCLQFKKYGLFKSNPLAGYPTWKWEGYAEYVARQGDDQKSLAHNIRRLIAAENTTGETFVYFADSSRTIIPYYRDWLLVQYCMDIKKMTYDELLKDKTDEVRLRDQ